MSSYPAVVRAPRGAALAVYSLGWKLLSGLERVTALAALVVLSPLLLLLAATIAFLSRRAPFVAHRRVGHKGEPFFVLKFRTMWNGERGPWKLVELLFHEPGPVLKQMEDPRVTHGFARFCRRYSLDELPQLLHVASGRMSLVGPRPLTRSELEQHYGRAVWKVLSAKPGLTGLWQSMGRNRLTYRQRVRLDLFLVNKWSFGLYLHILARTAPQVLLGKDSW